MVIRRAETKDIPALSELAVKTYCDAFGPTFTEPDLAVHLQQNLAPENIARFLEEDVILVAEGENRLIGYVQFGEWNSESGDVGEQELKRLYVTAEFQKRGIGTALIEAALNSPPMREAAAIYLDVWEHNHGAQKLYERYGFMVAGTRAFETESGTADSLDLIMVRRSDAAFARY